MRAKCDFEKLVFNLLLNSKCGLFVGITQNTDLSKQESAFYFLSHVHGFWGSCWIGFREIFYYLRLWKRNVTLKGLRNVLVSLLIFSFIQKRESTLFSFYKRFTNTLMLYFHYIFILILISVTYAILFLSETNTWVISIRPGVKNIKEDPPAENSSFWRK